MFFVEFLDALWSLLISISGYVLLGLFFVGLVHIYISEEWIKKHLGEKGWKSVVKGTLYGMPLPLCSCGVIPLATSLSKRGASKGAVTSFFITTPITGVDSLFATYGVFGLPMAVIRLISSVISGLAAGFLAGSESVDENKDSPKEESCCSSCGCESSKPKKSKLKEAYDYAIFNVFADIAKPMAYGLLAAALLVVLLPSDVSTWASSFPLLAYLGVLLIGLPMYVCSISAIPMALALVVAGFSPGVAFVFLVAAPATNIITATLVYKILGAKTLFVYMMSIIVTTLVFAYFVDALPQEWFVPTSSLEEESHSLLGVISAIIFTSMMLFFMFRKPKKEAC